MACKVLVIMIAFSALAGAVVPSVRILQGPGSRTSLYGPDGSAAESVAPGGTVITDSGGPSGLIAAGPTIVPASPEIIVGGGPVGRIVTSYTPGGPAIVPAVLL